MSAVTNIVVTPSTSLILIRNLSTLTNVYLSTFNAPNFSVTIRDTTGLVNTGTSSIRISTVGRARFLDGTNLYSLDKPYGLVNLAFRNSSFWQILHTSGQAPATAAANITTLNTSTSLLSFLSSGVKYASSLIVNDLLTTNAITLNNTFIIENLSAPGVIVVQSTMNVYGNVQIDGRLFVSGPAEFLSSVTVNNLLPISSFVQIDKTMGVGKNLSVGGITYVEGSLVTLSTNMIQTLQVQQSSPSISVLTANTLRVETLVSSLLGLTTVSQFQTPGLLTIQQDVSSIGGNVSTHSLHVGDYSEFLNSITAESTSRFLSNLTVGSSLTIADNGSLSTNLEVLGDAYAKTVSTFRFSTLSSFSTATLFGLSSVLIQNGLSTANLRGFGWLSIGTDFYTPAAISSLFTTIVQREIDVLGNVIASNVHVSSSVGIGSNVTVNGNSFFGSLQLRKHLSALGATNVLGYSEVLGNVGVFGNVTIDSNIIVQDGSVISSFLVNSFLLSNVEILTSSPFTSVRASTLEASSLQTQVTQIGIANPTSLSVYSTFASTTQFTTAIAEATRVSTVFTGAVAWGEKQTILSANSKPSFVLNTDSLFPTGLSAQMVRAQTILANLLNGTFLGDGANISNVAVPYAHLSALKTVASTVITNLLTASSFNVSSYFCDVLTTSLSSFSTPTFLVQSIGFPRVSTMNQLLALNSNTMVVNYGTFFDSARKRIGVLTSSPMYSLDINGILYASNIFYNTINPLGFSTTSDIYLSTLNVSSLIVRDRAYYPPGGMGVFVTGSNDATFLVRTTSSPVSTFGIFSYPSSIGLNNSIFIHNDTRRVMVNGLSNGTILTPTHDFTVQNNLYSRNVYVSSLNAQVFTSFAFDAPSLRIQFEPQLTYNSISTSADLLYLNTLITLNKESMALKGLYPLTTFDVRGNAFFSSLVCQGEPRATYLALGSEFV